MVWTLKNVPICGEILNRFLLNEIEILLLLFFPILIS